MTLTELRDALRKATGPDRVLDCHIHAAFIVRGKVRFVDPPTFKERRYFVLPDSSTTDWIGYDLLNIAPGYTASIDAAVTLVPEGYAWRCGQGSRGWAVYGGSTLEKLREHDAYACTAALALCLARVEYELARGKGE